MNRDTIWNRFSKWWRIQQRWHYGKLPPDDQEKIRDMLYEAWNAGRKCEMKRVRDKRLKGGTP